MEQLESLQRVNRQQRLAEWSRRVEALPEQRADRSAVVPGKWDRSIHLFFLAEEGVPGLEG